MKLIIFIFALLLCANQSLGQTCNNPLKSRFGFEGPAQAEVAQGIKVCKSLQNVASCCNADSFNKIQTKTDELIASLREKAIARDKVMADIRMNVLPGLMESLRKIKEASNKLGASSGGSTSGFDEFAQVFDKIGNMKNIFMAYQKFRTSCVIQMVKLQAATWCLACDANYASKGLAADGTLTLSTNMCKRLLNTCYDYIAGAEEQSEFIGVKIYAPLIEKLANAMEKMANGDASGMTELQNLITSGATQVTMPTAEAEKPIRKPYSCTKDSCSLICNTMFSGGVVDTSILANGGQVTTTLTRLLGQEGRVGQENNNDDASGRVLQSSSFEPDNDEAGVTVTFEDDPGNTNADSASATLVKVGVAAFIGLIALLI